MEDSAWPTAFYNDVAEEEDSIPVDIKRRSKSKISNG